MWTERTMHKIHCRGRSERTLPVQVHRVSIAMVTLVPDWLCGVWNRDYIRRRASNEKELGPPDSSVHVIYIQTPFAFCDVRRSPSSTKGAMAFAGVTSVVLQDDSVPPLVRWHACLDMEEPRTDPFSHWQDALSDKPRPTPDEGYFEFLSNNKYRERDPQGTLEEQWVKVNDGNGQYLAALLNGEALVVVAGDYFGFAMQAGSGNNTAIFCAGTTTGWKIEICSTDHKLEGTKLRLPGKPEQWKELPGSSLGMDTLHPCFQK